MTAVHDEHALRLTSYTREHPLLLVTDYAPDTQGGGAVILRSLLDGPDRESVVWASPSPMLDPSRAHSSETVFLRKGSAGRGGRRSLGFDSTIHAGPLAREVAALARQRSARAVWLLMHGAVVGIAARLTRWLNLPVHLTVHDDPAFANALRSRKYFALVPWIERDFGGALRRAASIDVISEGMRERYQLRYGVDSTIIHRGLTGPIHESPHYDRAVHGLTIGMMGSTYEYGQMPVLARAVARAAHELGVRGRVLVLGRSHGERLRDEMGSQIEVEVAGHVSEAEGIERLRDCFALYLNYPFGRRDAVLRQTSFPTKLSTYIQAARPVLIHAPDDSSVTPLYDYPGYAARWASMNVDDGATQLKRLWSEPASDASAHCAAEEIRHRFYDRDTNRRALREVLNALVP